jgi:hypothetical protein
MKRALQRALQISFRLRESVTQPIIPEIAVPGRSVSLLSLSGVT